jgi:hypothetical protein
MNTEQSRADIRIQHGIASRFVTCVLKTAPDGWLRKRPPIPPCQHRLIPHRTTTQFGSPWNESIFKSSRELNGKTVDTDGRVTDSTACTGVQPILSPNQYRHVDIKPGQG